MAESTKIKIILWQFVLLCIIAGIILFFAYFIGVGVGLKL
jgi:hypothetical protein